MRLKCSFGNARNAAPSEEPTFLAGDGVFGIVHILDATDTQFDYVEMILEGNISTYIHHDETPSTIAYSFCVREQVFSEKFKIPQAEFHPINGTAAMQTPFGFETFSQPPEYNRISNKYTLRDRVLPATLHSLPQPLPKGLSYSVDEHPRTAKFRVSYQLKAIAVRQNSVVATETFKIKILPTIAIEPPLCVDAFPGEFTKTSTLRRQQLFPRRRKFDLTLSADDIQPIVFAGNSDMASTTLSLRCQYRDYTGSLQRPRTARAQLSTDVCALKVVSVVRQKRHSSEAEVEASPYLFSERNVCWRQKGWAVPFTQWEPQGQDGATWTCSGKVLIPLQRSDLPVPSFFHPLISLRYKFIIKVCLKDPVKGDFLLRMPVQVVH